MLIGCDGTPAEIGAGIEAIYQALHERAHLWQGNALQTAANILYLSRLNALEIAERFALVVQQFRAAGAKIGQQEYDDLAILCFLALPVERIVATVLAIRDRLTASRWRSRRGDLGLATNPRSTLSRLRGLGADEELPALPSFSGRKPRDRLCGETGATPGSSERQP